jgi:hypothetical protein
MARMKLHAHAKLTPASGLLLCRRIQTGGHRPAPGAHDADEIAACLNMPQRTVSRICARGGLGA